MMTRSLLILLLLLGLSAALARYPREEESSPFSVDGVSLGMTREEVKNILGEPNLLEEKLLLYSAKEHGYYDTRVWYSSDWRVRRVHGSRLALGNRDFGTEDPHEELPQELWELLGEADWKSGERGDFAQEWGFDRYALVLQLGCTGWSFSLGEQ